MRGGSATSSSIEGCKACNALGSKASKGERGGSPRPWRKISWLIVIQYTCPKTYNLAFSCTCIVQNPIFEKSYLELSLELVEGTQWRKLLFLLLQQEITAKNRESFGASTGALPTNIASEVSIYLSVEFAPKSPTGIGAWNKFWPNKYFTMIFLLSLRWMTNRPSEKGNLQFRE